MVCFAQALVNKSWTRIQDLLNPNGLYDLHCQNEKTEK